MKYDELYHSFKRTFPEDQAFFEKMERENLIDETVGMHPIFGLVVVPYIMRNLCEKNIANVEKIFSFLEEMTVCEDADVAGVLDFTVLEHLVDEGHAFITECKRYMGKNTLEHCEEVEKYFL